MQNQRLTLKRKKLLKNSVIMNLFLEFFREILISVPFCEKQNKKIIIDNSTYFTTKEIIDFFKDNKIKCLTICPYKSSCNMNELVFSYIKNIGNHIVI